MHAPVVSVDKDVDIEHVLHVMRKHNISKLPVTEKGRLVGILTDGAIADELGALKNRTLAPGHLHASSVMQREFSQVTPEDNLAHIRNILEDSALGLVPVTHDTTVLGVITKADLLEHIDADIGVADAMIAQVHTVAPTERVVHARRIMIDQAIQRLPVVDEGRPVGIVAEMDLAIAFETMKRRVDQNHQSQHLKNLQVGDVMSAPVHTIPNEADIKTAAAAMRQHNVGCLPVINAEGILQGIVTRGDLIRAAHHAA